MDIFTFVVIGVIIFAIVGSIFATMEMSRTHKKTQTMLSDFVKKMEEEVEKKRNWILENNVVPKRYSLRTEKSFEKLGGQFLHTVKTNIVFQYVKLPKGWTKKVCPDEEYPIFSYVTFLDQKGKKRGGIHNISNEYTSFSIYTRYQISKKRKRICVVDLAKDDEIIFEALIDQKEANQEAIAIKEAEKKAAEWLYKNYPQWQDPLAYWE